jgi:uncharacterized protein YndB with AHSA1/START domain
MNDFSLKMHLKARPAEVYTALATKVGIMAWWTRDLTGTVAIGDTFITRFGNTWNVVRIKRLDPDREVRWTVVDQYHHAEKPLSKSDEWVGTEIVFKLENTGEEGTLLRFEHRGLMPELECYDICDAGWNRFVGASLRSLVETGQGQPFEADRAA